MAELRTFIFTDIVRSVALKSEMEGRNDTQRDRAFIETVLTPHRERIETSLSEREGRIVSTAGDGHFLVFSDTGAAAQWAIDVQKRHTDTPITTPKGSVVEVRVSLHVGVPQIDPRDPNNFVGKPVDYAARLNDFARGGQVLCSRAVAAILEDVQLDEVRLHSHGPRMLRGIGRVEVYEIVYREAGPMETLYHPVKQDARQWTIIPPGPSGPGRAYPAAAPPAAGSSQAAVVPASVPRRLGNYELEELLGSGGMGDVYKARHTLFERKRAIKVIKQGLVDAGRTDVIRRFYQEIKAVGKLDHKNIVVAVESSTPNDQVHYLVMEYIEGISLDELVSQHGPLPVPDACEAIRQAARGLQYIHKHGLVHRDIKPSNLMLTIVERTGTFRMDDSSVREATQKIPLIKILDLGLALLVDDDQGRLTHIGQRAMGTGMYMSPEQWKSPSVDIRADIYSLGCTLYHMLAGRPPFLDSDLKPEKAHEKSKIPPITGPTPVPRKLWDVIRKMLAKNPDERFQRPDEIVAALAPFSEGHKLVELARRYTDGSDGDATVVGTTAVSHPHIETLPIDSKTSRPPQWRRKNILWAGGLALLLLFIAVAIAVFFRDPRVLAGPAIRQEASDLLITLPGMNGLWWFEELPWLTPHDRVRLLAGMRESEFVDLRELARRADVQDFYGTLEPAVLRAARVPEQRLSRLIGDDRALMTLTRDVLGSYDPLLHAVNKPAAEKELQRLKNHILNIDPNRRSPATWHLLGVLQTHLQDFETHLQDFKDAEESLKRAEDAYREVAASGESPAADVAQSLSALVAGDRANLYLSQSDFRRARQQIGDALDCMSSEVPTPFHVYTLGMRSQAGLYDRDAEPQQLVRDLAEAERYVRRLELEENHPLRAYLHERRAHFALETWHLSEAVQQAEQASRLREVFAGWEPLLEGQVDVSKSRAPVSGSHHAQQGWFRAQQIVALALHFKGSLDLRTELEGTEAWVHFKRLVDHLSLSERVTLTNEQARVWQQLKPNFRGRKADAELFTMGAFAEAAESYGSGIRVAQERLQWDDDPQKVHFLVFMLYKRAIALLLDGQAQRAADVLQDANGLDSKIEDPNRKRRFETFKKVAMHLADRSGQKYSNLANTLQEEAKALEGRFRDRDNRQLLLFVAAYLRELIDEGVVSPESGEFPPDAELQAVIERLLDPLKRDERRDAGDIYLERIEESASEAVRLLKLRT